MAIDSFSEYVDRIVNQNREILTESSLSRIWQHIESGDNFGVVSAFRSNYSNAENMKRHSELKKRVRDKLYGFIELEGGFNEEGTLVKERSLFIPEISRADIINLGKYFDQYSVIYKDNREFVEIGTSAVAGIGVVKNNFANGTTDKKFVLDPEITKDLFSRLIKGSHREKKFLFNIRESYLYELVPLTFNQAAYHKGRPHKCIKLV